MTINSNTIPNFTIKYRNSIRLAGFSHQPSQPDPTDAIRLWIQLADHLRHHPLQILDHNLYGAWLFENGGWNRYFVGVAMLNNASISGRYEIIDIPAGDFLHCIHRGYQLSVGATYQALDEHLRRYSLHDLRTITLECYNPSQKLDDNYQIDILCPILLNQREKPADRITMSEGV